MDISYLLFLQNLRNSTHDAWTPFFEGVSLFAITYLFLLPVFIYWCLSKRNGLYIICATYFAFIINALVKLSACAYRPWIRDARIVPAGDAIKTATGYSFPSGHVMGSTPIYGGLTVIFWQKKFTRWLSVLCVLAILLTGFSRNYLGVHTPQDVGVGLILGVFSLVVVAWVMRHPEHENKFLFGGMLLGILALLYITFKPYPMDYLNGKLVVDPAKMLRDGYHHIGEFTAYCVARYIEKRWINFKETGLSVKGVLLTLIGMIPLCFMSTHLRTPMVAWLGEYWGRFCTQSCLVIYIVALYPLVIKWCTRQKN